ncbi:pre-mRNA cleavage complex 2 protein Pcf11 [Danio rerio]|uniref:Pre-mRNA cleavage complex 2 protein Pcf11 n=1 Tax=Danio rerio TaxID=7955 RepID=Q5U393_DANRE|nr:pre-mRNA cleavage complex 2 protein Pcf11 [Danio rerio]AAH85652.1 Cleavage and polyadenylation factor subunit, homolog (S. cerevisiae) [Danio rerio]|eukprot:NP_001007308.1 pre-mRNA cleavage complex 2 protein Pcf11 [Danio rerio]
MSDDGAREDACREYQSSLEDLTFNSKPHINMLTILAEENIQFTKDIVAIIEAQIAKAPPVEKLPVLYLVDSIVKNVGGAYLEVFAKNLVNSFICVFEKVDEGTRKSLFKLRSTWDEIFPLKKLYALDVRVNSVDPAWPIKPLPPNVNASIHVNPKFLKPTEETPPKPTPPPPTPSLTQEQLIRQQLLAKQKQLLELQQKKIELELEQTKAQLAASPSLALNHHASAPVRFNASPKVNPTVPVPQTKSWPPAPSEKLSTRDPRLNRSGTTAVNPKEQVTHKKESPAAPSFQNAPEKRGQASSERPAKLDKLRIPKKDNSAVEEKSKSKSMLPSGKVMPVRPRGLESEQSKSAEVNKKDPRLHKQMHERMDSKDEDVREKKRSSEKKDRDEGSKNLDHQKLSSNRGKLINGSVNKHEKLETFLKQEIKVNKANVRKRSRSRSPPVHSPKRKERRSSPKRKTRSISPPPKSGKSRLSKHPHDDAFPQPSARDERTKKSVPDSRRPKRPLEDRPAEKKDGSLQRISAAEHKDLKDGKRWRSGWEENKHPKHSDTDLSHGRMGIQKHKTWNTNQRPPTPRTPKQHRLSVDSNIQIPEALHSASKRDLLRKASKRRADGEISNDEFLSVAHQINQLFQYQEERQRSDSWDESCDEGVYPSRKKQETISDAYLEHKLKLRRTQLHRPVQRGGHLPLHEMYHYPPHHEVSEQYSESLDVHKMSGDPIKPLSDHEDHRRIDRPPSCTGSTFRNSPSPVGLDGICGKSTVLPFERPSSPSEMDQQPEGDISPRFESPNSVHSGTGPDDGPISVEGLPRHDHFLEQGRSGRIHGESPGNTPSHSEGPTTQVNAARHDGPIHQRFDRYKNPQAPFDGPSSHMREPRLDGPPRPFVPPSRYESNTGGFDGSGGPVRFSGHRFDTPHHFEQFPKAPERPVRFNNPQVSHRPMRFVEPHNVRFDSPTPVHYDHSMPQNRFVNPPRFDNPQMQQGPPGYEEPHFPARIINYDEQQGPVRFDNPTCGIRFENPVQPEPLRFDAPPVMPRYDPQGPPRYCGPNIPNQLRPQEPTMYDQTQGQGPMINPTVPPPNFNMPPINSFGGPAQQFSMQQNVSQTSNFSVPVPTSSDFQGSFRPPFPGPGVGGVPQPMMGAQNFMPQNPMPFQPVSQFPQPEPEPLRQIDVNDLMSKLISTGIIKPAPTDSTADSPSASQTISVPEEEEEEEEQEQEEDDSVPDLTGFILDDMKQRHESIITKLYTGIQCYSCGMRFTASQTDVYADHLDWHYRQNRSEKDISKKVTHRRWYYSLTDWIEFEEIADLEERAKSQFFEKVHEEVVQKTQEAAKEREFQSVKAAADVVHELCEICQEQFEMYWEEEEEEWHLKNAIRVDEKTYHPSCYEDYKNTSSFMDTTPSPNKMLTENPLTAFLKQEQDDETSCSSIKEEPADDDMEAPMVKEEVQVKLEGESQTSAIVF